MKKIIGKVISDKMQSTKVVEKIELRAHPIYKKGYKVNKSILADDKDNIAKIDDIVEIIPTRPISKRKAWKISRVVEK